MVKMQFAGESGDADARLRDWGVTMSKKQGSLVRIASRDARAVAHSFVAASMLFLLTSDTPLSGISTVSGDARSRCTNSVALASVRLDVLKRSEVRRCAQIFRLSMSVDFGDERGLANTQYLLRVAMDDDDSRSGDGVFGAYSAYLLKRYIRRRGLAEVPSRVVLDHLTVDAFNKIAGTDLEVSDLLSG